MNLEASGDKALLTMQIKPKFKANSANLFMEIRGAELTRIFFVSQQMQD